MLLDLLPKTSGRRESVCSLVAAPWGSYYSVGRNVCLLVCQAGTGRGNHDQNNAMIKYSWLHLKWQSSSSWPNLTTCFSLPTPRRTLCGRTCHLASMSTL